MARAACADPHANAGDLVFNNSDAVLQYCNGAEWIGFPKGASGGGGCSDISSWTARTAAANSWHSVTYGNGLFVAVAQDGTNRVMTSPDGITWTGRSAAAANSWKSVTYGNGLFVAVAQTGTNRVMTSPDGITWTARAAAEANSWESVTYGNGMFVAVAAGGTNRVMTSPDGITWTARAAAQANPWLAVTYGNGLFVAVAYSGTNRVMTSPDGITWTARMAAQANPWYGVGYGNGQFVAVGASGTHRVMTSPNGITWTARTAAAANVWNSVIYTNGLFVAVAESGMNRVMTSPDGITWTGHAAAGTGSWESVTFGNGRLVAVAFDGADRVMTADCLRPGCENPEGPAGRMIFNGADKVLQWCDGATWRAAGPPNAGGGASCTGPDAPVGKLMFNGDYRVLQYCDGDQWRAIGHPPCTSCGGSPDEKVVFYTMSAQSIGNTFVNQWGGGVAGADALCADRAAKAGLKGSYKAWIADSDPASAPASRFTHAAVPYVRVDGVKIADDWADLTGGSLDAAIITETGYIPGSPNGVWTNVAADGTQRSADPTAHCNDWMGGGGATGHIGHRAFFMDSRWTAYGAEITCGASERLFCFEQ